MNKPSKYKSVPATFVQNRPVFQLNETEKAKVKFTLDKLIDLIKLKHS